MKKKKEPLSADGSRSLASPLDSVFALATQLDGPRTDYGRRLSDFNVVGELGRGSFGTVFKVEARRFHNQVFVLKCIPINHMDQRQQRDALREVLILRKLSHPNIIRYYTSFLEDGCIYILMEYAAGGDLYSVIDSAITISVAPEGPEGEDEVFRGG